ncbi:MAG: flagellar capping protein [Lachnospiraceae bacterium]|nr:flagellar capping protein [Lachnospiraceae bacterium]
MTYNTSLHAVYNHYLTTYAPKTTTQYDTHKKSELRNIYHSIVKLNKESPLYLLDSSNESRAFAVGLKENARALRNTIASLGGLDETEMLGKKSAYSSNPDIATATYVGGSNIIGASPSFNIEVTALASNQLNLGSFLPASEKADLTPGAYSFDISINDLNYEFQYNIRGGESNRDLQERLARLISNAEIGVNADVFEDDKGRSSLRLVSTASGLKPDRDYIFHVSDETTSKLSGTVDYLGLNFMSRQPSNARFLLDGEPRTASTNHFTIDKIFDVTLNGISSIEGETAEIGLKTDLDSLTENVNDLVHGYNAFVKAAAEYLDSHPRSKKLINEMSHISRHYQEDLEQIGFSFDKSGQLAIDDDAFKSSILSDENRTRFTTIRDFTNTVLRKTNQVSLNPMEYVDKRLVAYKNPGHNFATPYMTSNYSGMLFNGYC